MIAEFCVIEKRTVEKFLRPIGRSNLLSWFLSRRVGRCVDEETTALQKVEIILTKNERERKIGRFSM